MAKKPIRPLRSEADYDVAVEEIERYFEKTPARGTPEADRFDLLALIIEDYERKHWPIEAPDPVDAIRYRMETAATLRQISADCSARVNEPRTFWLASADSLCRWPGGCIEIGAFPRRS